MSRKSRKQKSKTKRELMFEQKRKQKQERECLSCHHKKCRSNGGTNDPENLSYIKRHLHESWHSLFSNLRPRAIARLINKVYLDPEWRLVAVRKEVIL